MNNGISQKGIIAMLVFGCGFGFFICNMTNFDKMSEPSLSLHINIPDIVTDVVQLRDGVCAKGLPDWNKGWILSELPHFLSVYNYRPIGDNPYGTQLMHQFAVWCIVRHIQPKHIIESGIYKGFGTWLLRQAAPTAQIILLDPDHAVVYVDRKNDTVYFTGKNFRDFSTISSWTEIQLNSAETLAFLDDHQIPFKRIQQARIFGIKHMIFDDNYSIGGGDILSLKQGCACRLNEIACRLISYQDDFNRIQRNLTYYDIKLINKTFDDIMVYHEFPMIWNVVSKTIKEGSKNYLYNETDGKILLTNSGLTKFPADERLCNYYNIAYVRLP